MTLVHPTFIIIIVVVAFGYFSLCRVALVLRTVHFPLDFFSPGVCGQLQTRWVLCQPSASRRQPCAQTGSVRLSLMPPPVVLVRLFVWLSVLGIVEMTRPFWAAKNKRDFQTCTNSLITKV